MAVRGAQVSVAASATLLAKDDDSLSTPTVILKNRDTSLSVFIGGDDVTTGTGFELKPADPPFPFKLENGNAIYGRVASGTVRVDVLEIGD